MEALSEHCCEAALRGAGEKLEVNVPDAGTLLSSNPPQRTQILPCMAITGPALQLTRSYFLPRGVMLTVSLRC